MARADVKQDDLATAGKAHQLLTWHVLGLLRVVPSEVGHAGPVGGGQMSQGDIAQSGVQASHVFAGEPVVHARAFLAGPRQPGLSQRLQMHRRGGHSHAGGPCEHVDGALTLGQQVEQLKPLRG